METKTPIKRRAFAYNTISVIKKFFAGSFIILLVGICAFVSLLLLMKLV